MDSCIGFPLLSYSYLYKTVNTRENDDISFVRLVIEIPQVWRNFQLVPTPSSALPWHTETINGLQDFHCSLTSSCESMGAPNGPFFGVSTSWEILNTRLFFGTNTSCEIQRTDNGVYSGAQKLLRLLTGWFSYKVFLNPVSAHGQVSKEHVVLVHEHSALVHEHLALGTSTQHNYGWGTRPPEAWGRGSE